MLIFQPVPRQSYIGNMVRRIEITRSVSIDLRTTTRGSGPIGKASSIVMASAKRVSAPRTAEFSFDASWRARALPTHPQSHRLSQYPILPRNKRYLGRYMSRQSLTSNGTASCDRFHRLPTSSFNYNDAISERVRILFVGGLARFGKFSASSLMRILFRSLIYYGCVPMPSLFPCERILRLHPASIWQTAKLCVFMRCVGQRCASALVQKRVTLPLIALAPFRLCRSSRRRRLAGQHAFNDRDNNSRMSDLSDAVRRASRPV